MSGADIRARRRALGWSAPMLAELVGLAASSVYSIEAERYLPPPRTLEALDHVLRKGNNVAAWTYPPPAELARFWTRKGIV